MPVDTETTHRQSPSHVAIIMDGNGRWARARGLPRTFGHKRGADVVVQTVRDALDLDIKYLTLFGFSSENWKRPLTEIGDLMGLLRRYLTREIAELHAKGVRFQVIGERAKFAPDIIKLIDESELLTLNNTNMTLTVALSYGGRAEIVDAARQMAEAVAHGEIDPSEIDEERFQARLQTNDMPDPDLLIRTSGEKRLSNFMLWQCAYTEFVFLDSHWPDFSRTHLEAAIGEFCRRDRRYGAANG
jgi:undecaprenyl diphosphate synthase